MTELQPGDMLDTVHVIGNRIFGCRVVDTFTVPDEPGKWNKGMADCPECGGEDTYVAWFHRDQHEPKRFAAWYCNTCMIAWEIMED